MEKESFSWVSRVKFSPNAYIRSGSLVLPYVKRDLQSDKVLDLIKESLSSESNAAFVKSSNASSVSSKSGSKMEDSSLVSSKSVPCESSLQHGGFESSLSLLKKSNSQTVDFRVHSNQSSISFTIKLPSYVAWFTNSKKKLAKLKRKSKPKQRFVSPLPTAIDAFQEAKSNPQRLSTAHFYSVKGIRRKLRAKMETPWARYFDNGGVRVTAVETTEKWIVNLSELYFGARFASGAHSRLYHGMYKNQPVAVKMIRLPDEDEGGAMVARLENQFTREATFLSQLCHRNVIKLAGAYQKSPILFVITEYLSGGSLRALLRKLDHLPLPLDTLISIALDVSRGMEYIHSQGIVHRDLKSGNVLFDQNLCVKIADFGVACEEAYCDVVGDDDDAGTYRWMAPEMMKREPYGRKVDVFSFGLLLWEMVTGAIPYEEMTPVQAAFAVVNKNLRPVIPADCPAVLAVLIEKCWSTLPEKRPEFWQIVKALQKFESDLANGGSFKQPTTKS